MQAHFSPNGISRVNLETRGVAKALFAYFAISARQKFYVLSAAYFVFICIAGRIGLQIKALGTPECIQEGVDTTGVH